MPGKRKKSDIVRVSGRHRAKKGDKALIVKSGHAGWHYRPLKKRPKPKKK
jgi:hypothetical protein